MIINISLDVDNPYIVDRINMSHRYPERGDCFWWLYEPTGVLSYLYCPIQRYAYRYLVLG